MPESPLSEPDPYSLDTLSLTDSDIDAIVKDLREKRTLWIKEEAEAKTQGKRVKKVYKEVPEKGQLSLDYLNIVMPKREE